LPKRAVLKIKKKREKKNAKKTVSKIKEKRRKNANANHVEAKQSNSWQLG